MKKKCEVVMLPTEKAITEGSIISRAVGDNLAIVNCLTIDDKNAEKDGHQNNHLYLISDDEIKEGDWVIDLSISELFKAETKYIKLMIAAPHLEKSVKKVIASTDFELTRTVEWGQKYKEQFPCISTGVPLPSLPAAFIQYYVKVGGVKKVFVEYESFNSHHIGNERPVVREDGTIGVCIFLGCSPTQERTDIGESSLPVEGYVFAENESILPPMEDIVKMTLEIEADAKTLYGTDCGGGTPYHYATPADIERLLREEIEKTGNISVSSLNLENPEDTISLEEENENLSAENVTLTNRISELSKEQEVMRACLSRYVAIVPRILNGQAVREYDHLVSEAEQILKQ